MAAPSAFFPCPRLRRRTSSNLGLGFFPLLVTLVLGTFSGKAMAQGTGTHTYSAQLIRPAGVNPMKPLLAGVMDRFPDADVALEREDDVLLITTDQELSPAGLRVLLAPYGVQLATFLKDGVPVDGPAGDGRTLPWLSDLEERARPGPEEIAARKDAWVTAHPEEYRQWINASVPTPERQ